MNHNRLANTKNLYQGNSLKVLCVCSAGLLRSPTVAWILSNDPFNFNTRAVGISQEYALIPIDAAHIFWADRIVCMDDEQAKEIAKIAEQIPYGKDVQIDIIDIPDAYGFRDPILVDMATRKLLEIFND